MYSNHRVYCVVFDGSLIGHKEKQTCNFSPERTLEERVRVACVIETAIVECGVCCAQCVKCVCLLCVVAQT